MGSLHVGMRLMAEIAVTRGDGIADELEKTSARRGRWLQRGSGEPEELRSAVIRFDLTIELERVRSSGEPARDDLRRATFGGLEASRLRAVDHDLKEDRRRRSEDRRPPTCPKTARRSQFRDQENRGALAFVVSTRPNQRTPAATMSVVSPPSRPVEASALSPEETSLLVTSGSTLASAMVLSVAASARPPLAPPVAPPVPLVPPLSLLASSGPLPPAPASRLASCPPSSLPLASRPPAPVSLVSLLASLLASLPLPPTPPAPPLPS